MSEARNSQARGGVSVKGQRWRDSEVRPVAAGMAVRRGLEGLQSPGEELWLAICSWTGSYYSKLVSVFQKKGPFGFRSQGTGLEIPQGPL